MENLKRIYIKVDGRVQGVGFRYFVERQARKLNLKGYVKNLADGGLELTAEGENEALCKLKELVRRGPPGSMVLNMIETEENYIGEYQDFHITY